LTDTTLAPQLRHEGVPGQGTAVRLVVRWDRETGWGHLAIVEPGAARARFTGFHRFADGDPVTVIAELVAAGCRTIAAPRHGDDLVEVHAVLACQEVTPGAVR
jgi:hypothetical protein